MATGDRIVRSWRSLRGGAEMAFRAKPRWDRRAVDPKLHQFVALLHRPAPPPPRRELVRRAAKYAAGLLLVAAVGALLWFPWPGLNSVFKAPTAPSLILALPPAAPDPPVQPATSALPEPISAAHAELTRITPPPVRPAAEAEQV